MLILQSNNLTQGFMVFLIIFHKVTKFGMVRQCLSVSDIIHKNEYTLSTNCDFHVNFWNSWLVPFCFMIKQTILRKIYYFGISSHLKATWERFELIYLLSFYCLFYVFKGFLSNQKSLTEICYYSWKKNIKNVPLPSGNYSPLYTMVDIYLLIYPLF